MHRSLKVCFRGPIPPLWRVQDVSDPIFVVAKTWAILMSPTSRKAAQSTQSRSVPIRTLDSPAIDSVENLTKDDAYATCVGCQQSTLEHNRCSFCHRTVCNSCSARCEICLYHYCAVCRTVKYVIALTTFLPVGPSLSAFSCL